MRPSDWRSPLKIGNELCRKLIGKGQLLARLSVAKTRTNGVAVTCWEASACFEKDATNVNSPAKGVPKPTPVIYEPGVLI